MKKTAFGILAGLAVGAIATWFALRHSAVDEPAEAAAIAPTEKAQDNPLHIPGAKRLTAGIALAKATPTTLAPEVPAYGHVLDPAPLLALAADVESARTALAASEKAFTRLEKLHAADANASAQAVEAAEAAMKHDRTALSSARGRLIASVGPSLAASADVEQMTASLEQGRALARLDVPAGEAVASDLKSARVGLLSGGELVDATVLGAAPTADPQVQGQGFLALLRGPGFPIGAALQATMPGPGAAQPALVVPRTAVVYHLGSAWVYVLEKGDTFTRKLVTLGRALGDRVVIASGLDDDDQLAVTGAQQLLSAELQAGGAPDGG